MKLIAPILISLIYSTAAFAGDALPALSCSNFEYRESRYVLRAEDSMTISDTFLESDSTPILRFYEKQLNLTAGSLSARKVSLTIPVSDLDCSVVGRVPLSCQGQSTRGILDVDAFYVSNGQTAFVSFSDRVEVVSFRLDGKMSSLGPIKLGGSAPTTVTLNNWVLDTKAQLKLKGEAFDFEDLTHFYVDRKTGFSHCD